MGVLWFVLLVLVLTAYILLDGFDIGVGIVYLFIARSDDERRIALNAIAPIWNGNEVWLIVSGGVLFLAFPKVYSAGLSGFYLGLFFMLWLLIARGLSLELRSHVDSAVWQAFWDTVFSGSSLALAAIFGVMLGNLVRGVPLNADGYFFTPLWTNWLPGVSPGLLDWYTVLVALFSVAVLAVYGANYASVKTGGQIGQRAEWLGSKGWWGIVVLGGAVATTSLLLQPILIENYGARPVGVVFPLVAVLGLVGMLYYRRRVTDVITFLSTGLFVLALLASVAFGLFPNLLTATTGPAYSLTVDNAAAPPQALGTAVLWFAVAIALVIAYTVYSYLAFRGKVTLSSTDEGY
jgi:cytochrome d ubiquinol oxidase subunit II